MPGYTDPGFDTLALHAGAAPDPTTGARAVPIHLSTSFVFESSDHAAALFNMERSGHVYSRISNPTTAVLEERIAALEGGIGAIATASGQAALHLAITTLGRRRQPHRRRARALYGGSHNLLHYTLARFGISDDLRQARRYRRLARGDPARNAAAVRRDARQPGARRARHPDGRGDRPRARPAAAGRLDAQLAVADQAVRARRRPALSLGDQIPRRSRHRRRRRAGRQRRIRLGSLGPLSRVDRAVCRLSRHGLQRGEHDRAPSCCARGAKACAISAPASARIPLG